MKWIENVSNKQNMPYLFQLYEALIRGLRVKGKIALHTLIYSSKIYILSLYNWERREFLVVYKFCIYSGHYSRCYYGGELVNESQMKVNQP
jgi:hypothetical protein